MDDVLKSSDEECYNSCLNCSTQYQDLVSILENVPTEKGYMSFEEAMNDILHNKIEWSQEDYKIFYSSILD